MSVGRPVKAVAVGEFDGVHLGHQAVFAEAVRQAQMLGGTAAGVTFEPRVDRVLARPGASVLGDLGSVDDRKQLMLAQGLDEVAVLEFNSERAQWQPERFLKELRKLWPTVEVLVAGEDFAFGAKGSGNAKNFQQIATLADEQRPLRGVFVPAVRTQEGEKVSSSQIREALLAGNVDDAATWLGRCYQLHGHVVHGRAVGRTRGIPTANLDIAENILIPGPGVYAVDVLLPDGSRCHGGAFVKDAHDQKQSLYRQPIEVHLLDFSGDLYGTDLIVEFRSRIRGYRQFASADEAVTTIKDDLGRIRGARQELSVLKGFCTKGQKGGTKNKGSVRGRTPRTVKREGQARGAPLRGKDAAESPGLSGAARHPPGNTSANSRTDTRAYKMKDHREELLAEDGSLHSSAQSGKRR